MARKLLVVTLAVPVSAAACLAADITTYAETLLLMVPGSQFEPFAFHRFPLSAAFPSLGRLFCLDFRPSKTVGLLRSRNAEPISVVYFVTNSGLRDGARAIRDVRDRHALHLRFSYGNFRRLAFSPLRQALDFWLPKLADSGLSTQSAVVYGCQQADW